MDAAQFTQLLQAMKNLFPQPATGVSTTVMTSNFDNFDGELESFQQYVERFENFCSLNNLTDEAIQKRTFLNSIGPNLYEKCKSLLAPKTIADSTYTEIVKALQEHIAPSINKLVALHRLLSRVQQSEESCSGYVAVLRKLVGDCKLNCSCGKSVSDLFLCAQFIRGLRDNNIREHLLQNDLSFKEIVQKALASEAAKINAHEVASPSVDNPLQTSIHRISSSRRQRDMRSMSHGKKYRYRVDFEDIGISDLCIRCGENNHTTSRCEIASSELECSSCHKKGHVARVCISTLVKNKNHTLSSRNISNISDFQDFQPEFEQNSINKIEIANLFATDFATKKYEIEIEVADKKVMFEVDSGSSYTLIPKNEFQRLNLNTKLGKPFVKFRTYDGGIVIPLGVANVPVWYNNKNSVQQLFVVPDGLSPLLGRTWIRHLNISLQEIDSSGKQ